jgi:hypothetical protein
MIFHCRLDSIMNPARPFLQDAKLYRVLKGATTSSASRIVFGAAPPEAPPPSVVLERIMSKQEVLCALSPGSLMRLVLDIEGKHP